MLERKDQYSSNKDEIALENHSTANVPESNIEIEIKDESLEDTNQLYDCRLFLDKIKQEQEDSEEENDAYVTLLFQEDAVKEEIKDEEKFEADTKRRETFLVGDKFIRKKGKFVRIEVEDKFKHDEFIKHDDRFIKHEETIIKEEPYVEEECVEDEDFLEEEKYLLEEKLLQSIPSDVDRLNGTLNVHLSHLSDRTVKIIIKILFKQQELANICVLVIQEEELIIKDEPEDIEDEIDLTYDSLSHEFVENNSKDDVDDEETETASECEDEEIDVVSVDRAQPPPPKRIKTLLPVRPITCQCPLSKPRRANYPSTRRHRPQCPLRQGPRPACPQRRIRHINMERQRRVELRAHFHELRDLLPEMKNKDNVSKVAILAKAAEYCKVLVSDCQARQKQVDVLLAEQKLLLKRVTKLRAAMCA